MNNVNKYLQRHAEPETRALVDWPASYRYQHSLVIPAFDEQPDFISRLLDRPLSQQRPLLILVVNRPDHVDHCPANQLLLEQLQQTMPSVWQHGPLRLLDNGDWGILCVDRDQLPIPKKQGVGLARKLGADIAAGLIEAGFIDSPWIHSSDADAHLPDHYFQTQQLSIDTAAATYSFIHRRGSDLISRATEWYERSLHHYVNGLKAAGSPYAFHTIGSILVINSNHYCQVRGFPKRSGGEDFYLLNKLAKLGKIDSLDGCIELEPRLSHRVPFGTGPATAKLAESLANGQPLLSYHPQIFIQLQQVIATFESAFKHSHSPQQALQQLPEICQQALTSLGIEQCLQHLQQNADGHWKRRHFHEWLDGFRTLKFVHYLEREAFPPCELND